MHMQLPVAAHLPYIPATTDYALRKSRQLCNQFPHISRSKAREAVARALGFRSWNALEEEVKLPDRVEGTTDDALDAQALITRHNWQVNAVAQYLSLEWRDVQAFVATWNLTGPSRGGALRQVTGGNPRASALARHSRNVLVQRQAQAFVHELGAGDWTQPRPADTGALAQKWLELVSAGPLSLTRVHEQCLQHDESWCARYVKFLENVLSVATTRHPSEVARQTFTLVIRGKHHQIGQHMALSNEDRADLHHLLETRFGVEGAELSPLAVVSTAGASCWDESVALDACAWLKGASVEVAAQTASFDDEDGPDSGSMLVVFFSVADDWVSQVKHMMSIGANQVASELNPLKAYTPLSGARIELLNPVEALTRTGFTYQGGDNMLETLFEVPAVEAVTIAVTWAMSPGAWIPEFRIECTARKRDGTVMKGKLSGMMPVLYVNRVRASCVKWMASLQVKYHKTRDNLHQRDG